MPSHLLSKSHTEYREGTTLVDMIKEDLIAERIAIESYTEMIAFVGETEPTTRRTGAPRSPSASTWIGRDFPPDTRASLGRVNLWAAMGIAARRDQGHVLGFLNPGP
jgi:hypothetical protein